MLLCNDWFSAVEFCLLLFRSSFAFEYFSDTSTTLSCISLILFSYDSMMVDEVVDIYNILFSSGSTYVEDGNDISGSLIERMESLLLWIACMSRLSWLIASLNYWMSSILDLSSEIYVDWDPMISWRELYKDCILACWSWWMFENYYDVDLRLCFKLAISSSFSLNYSSHCRISAFLFLMIS